MHTKFISALVLTLTIALSCGKADGTWGTASPDGKVNLTIQAAKGSRLTYSISYDGKTAVEPSSLGFTLEGVEYGISPVLKKITEKHVSDDYTLKAGKKLNLKKTYKVITNSYIPVIITSEHKDPGRALNYQTAQMIIDFVQAKGTLNYHGAHSIIAGK